MEDVSEVNNHIAVYFYCYRIFVKLHRVTEIDNSV